MQSKQESLLQRLDELDHDNDHLRGRVAELEDSSDQLLQQISSLTQDKDQLMQQISEKEVVIVLLFLHLLHFLAFDAILYNSSCQRKHDCYMFATTCSIFAARCYASVAYVITQCPSICVCVCHVRTLCQHG